jgi:ribosome biogenesis GTPase
VSSLPPQLAAFASDLDPTLVLGRVSRVDRALVTVETAPLPLRCHCGSEPAAVGDWVGVDAPTATVVSVLPRYSAVVRRAAGRPTASQVLAANVDVVAIAHSLQRAPNLRRLERELVVAWESGAIPLVVLTKADLAADLASALDEVGAVALGVDVVAVSVVTECGLSDVAARLAGRTSVMVGASGTGKSTLTNALVGADVQDTGGVRLTDGRGRHTTTAGQLLTLQGGGVIIDTPGLRELALWDASDGLDRVFADIDELAQGCRFNDCDHRTEDGCAVRDSVEPDRLLSWRKLQREMARIGKERAGWEKAKERKSRRAFARAIRDQPYRP